MEFEAKSAKDGAWYDVATFISHRKLETGDPEVLVRFAGFGAEEDEWLNVRRHVRQRSLQCEASECVLVLPGDLILCFQEAEDKAFYFDAHVLDVQRWRHDIRGCRCRFLVRYDHDQSMEIVPLRKVYRRPETSCRLQVLRASEDVAPVELRNAGKNPSQVNTSRNISTIAGNTLELFKLEEKADEMVVMSPPCYAKDPVTTETTMTTTTMRDEKSNHNNTGTQEALTNDASLAIGTVTSTGTDSGTSGNMEFKDGS